VILAWDHRAMCCSLVRAAERFTQSDAPALDNPYA
jgi:hypothetical protein